MKKQGISLIVLVITIIVLAILAAAVIISINNTGVINETQQTVLNDAVANLRDSLVMEYAKLKINANKPDVEGNTPADGAITAAVAAPAYDLVITTAGFTATAALSETNNVGVYIKTIGVHTVTVTLTLLYDGDYTLTSAITSVTK